jgi:hypothetical protein
MIHFFPLSRATIRLILWLTQQLARQQSRAGFKRLAPQPGWFVFAYDNIKLESKSALDTELAPASALGNRRPLVGQLINN